MGYRHDLAALRVFRVLGTLLAASLLILTFTPRALAQSVVVPPASIPSLGPSVSGTPSGTGEGAVAAVQNVLQTIEPSNGLRYGFTHVLITLSLMRPAFKRVPGQKEDTIIQTLAPGLRTDIGNHWSLDYTPTLAYYSSPEFQDSLNHNVLLTGSASYQDWTFNLSQVCSLASQFVIQTASQIDEQDYRTVFDAHYLINDTAYLDLTFNQGFRFVTQSLTNAQSFTNELAGYGDWSTLAWLNRNWGPNLSAGLGIGGGYTSVSAGSDTVNEQVRGRVIWSITHKMSLTVNGGVEVLQFLDSTAPVLISPVFGGTLIYQPSQQTSVSLSAERDVLPSYFANQQSEVTLLSASVRQRLLGRFYLTLSGGYDITTFTSSASGVSGNPDLNSTFFRAELSIPVLKRGTASMFYAYSTASSAQPGLSYASNQAGFSLGYRF